MSRDKLYATHILECISRIERYVGDSKGKLTDSDLVQDAVMRNLQTLAESAGRLSAELKERYATVDWRAIGGFRNVIVHDYLGVDIDGIWDVVENDLPVLRKVIMEALADLAK